MREYVPKYPLENLDRMYYPHLFKDSDNVVFSENLTYFVLEELGEKENRKLEEIESIVDKDCANVDVAYHDFSGNRWIFLILDKNQTEPILRRMEGVFVKLCKKLNLQIAGSQV